MRQIKVLLAVTSLAACFTVTNSCSQKTTPDTASVLGVFVASTPCSEGTRPLPEIPVHADCELIRWNLTLYQNPKTFTPTTYKLRYTYGLAQQGTPGFTGGGTTVEEQGVWKMVNGILSKPDAIIYRLTNNKTNQTIAFLKLSDDLLHLLDTDEHLMIGTAAWTYTLNRISSK
ncbi:hypothetical protein FC093_08095 [Ilyomonas limi]|uniref:Lipocalin-like domain-containing protein n=1 Tax=Ilyomonas limi TaxID=2575867 RepID=A0A4U3L2X5_9BACT|nr:copper resistance protein NlpE N-terminal domain-containing protein [Ilyomonas limi]TKK69270.1 hypothetical protein FC093_08095 [Ilyomonas limi]